MERKYDYLIVGVGLTGSILARKLVDANKKVLVIEKRSFSGGNIFCENICGINVHKYGAHIFHTSNKKVWEFVNTYAKFNSFINSPIANYKGEIYNLPFNMNTFNRMWGTVTPEQAKQKIESQIPKLYGCDNLEEKALSLVGRDIYEKLIKGYTEKQWGKKAKELPAFIIGRLPLRFTYDNNYFDDKYQGIPEDGYNPLIENLLKGIEVRTGIDFLKEKSAYFSIADKIIFTGQIDAFYDYCFGELEYRSLRFETEIIDKDNYQGVAVVNYTDFETPYTRIIEHKHFEKKASDKTVITKEYPVAWSRDLEPYYPINNERNNSLYFKYAEKAKTEKRLIFAGRLGAYKYFDMDDAVENAIALADKIIDNDRS